MHILPSLTSFNMRLRIRQTMPFNSPADRNNGPKSISHPPLDQLGIVLVLPLRSSVQFWDEITMNERPVLHVVNYPDPLY